MGINVGDGGKVLTVDILGTSFEISGFSFPVARLILGLAFLLLIALVWILSGTEWGWVVIEHQWLWMGRRQRLRSSFPVHWLYLCPHCLDCVWNIGTHYKNFLLKSQLTIIIIYVIQKTCRACFIAMVSEKFLKTLPLLPKVPSQLAPVTYCLLVMSISKIKSLSSNSLDAFCSDGSHTPQGWWYPNLQLCLTGTVLSQPVWYNFYLDSISVGSHGSFQASRLNLGLTFFPH